MILVQLTRGAMSFIIISAQGLLEAMQDYQRMGPTKLTDETLESILWNKAPVGLQRGSVGVS